MRFVVKVEVTRAMSDAEVGQLRDAKFAFMEDINPAFGEMFVHFLTKEDAAVFREMFRGSDLIGPVLLSA